MLRENEWNLNYRKLRINFDENEITFSKFSFNQWNTLLLKHWFYSIFVSLLFWKFLYKSGNVLKLFQAPIRVFGFMFKKRSRGQVNQNVSLSHNKLDCNDSRKICIWNKIIQDNKVEENLICIVSTFALIRKCFKFFTFSFIFIEWKELL